MTTLLLYKFNLIKLLINGLEFNHVRPFRDACSNKGKLLFFIVNSYTNSYTNSLIQHTTAFLLSNVF